ncbi:MAG: beta-galactosidase [Candidatus Solibacter usitatus]|nr:beta-galactosidase [Candidatus Solibacter usitatus]
MRLLALLLAVSGLAVAAEAPAFVEAAEFPYYQFPQPLWERELVWLKNLGIDTVVFSIPWNWHRMEGGELDLTGRTSPRRDLIGFVRLLKRVGLHAWIRPLGPVKGWVNDGFPPGAGPDRQAWLQPLQQALASQLSVHGGPISLVEGGAGFDVPMPPAPITRVSITDPAALVRSRDAMALGRGALIWENIEDSLTPPGWEIPGGQLFQRGAISFAGDERANVAALRSGALLARYWRPVLGTEPHAVRPAEGHLPAGVSAHQLISPEGATVVSVVNQSGTPFHGQLRAYYPPLKRAIMLPMVTVPTGAALWIPVALPLSEAAFCRDCSTFSKSDQIVYATAELTAVEYENGILAMEFEAISPGEVVLQLARQPNGPLLAAGRPVKFDWDEKTSRARLPVPAGKAPLYRVRIGLAIQAPEASGFFVNATRLILGKNNHVAASYSSEEVAQRSRLRVPENFQATADPKASTEIDYQVRVPATMLHGEWADFALEADGVLLSRAHLQVLRPASLRVREAMSLHFGGQAELAVAPPIVPVDAGAGRNLTVTIRNNFPEIRNYVLEAQGEGFQFFPPRSEISIGASMERDIDVRVFANDKTAGLRPWRLRLSGSADVDLPVRFVVIPRNEAVAYSTDLDGDGSPEWILENQRVRAVFSEQNGGRWLEFVWKDSGLNVLPEDGAMAGSGPVEITFENNHSEARLVMRGKDWRRVVRIAGARPEVVFEQSTALPADAARAEKRNEVIFRVTRDSTERAVYSLEPAER